MIEGRAVFDNFIGSGQIIDMIDKPMVLNDPWRFHGTIAGFDGSNAIELFDLPGNGPASVSFTQNAAGTGGVLDIARAQQHLSHRLMGLHGTSGFDIARHGERFDIHVASPT